MPIPPRPIPIPTTKPQATIPLPTREAMQAIPTTSSIPTTISTTISTALQMETTQPNLLAMANAMAIHLELPISLQVRLG